MQKTPFWIKTNEWGYRNEEYDKFVHILKLSSLSLLGLVVLILILFV